jgi:lipopolysaccharide transport system ATP-binding protein
LLDEAQVRKDGPSPSVFDYYEGLITSKRIGAVHTTELGAGLVRVTSGSGDALVEAIRLLGPDGEETDTLEVGVAAKLAFIVRAIRPISTLTLGFSIRDRLGQTVFTANTRNFRKEQINVDAGKIVTFHFSFNANIGAGTYSVSTILSGENGTLANRLETQELAYFFAVHNTTRPLSAGTAWLDPSLNISRDLG